MSPPTKSEMEACERREERRVWIWLALVLGVTMAFAGSLDLFFAGVPLGFKIPLLNREAAVSVIAYHVTVIALGVYVGYLGLKELIFEKRFSVEFLMAVAALGAVYLGYLFEGATVLFLYSLSEYFEGYIEDRARKAVEKLSSFMPDTARVKTEAKITTVDVKEIRPGTTIIIRPGERIALDGTVAEGESTVDQSLVTGESTPATKKTGSEVFAGTLNLSGELNVSVTKGCEDTLVSRIAKLVMESRKRKASIERLVDRFARFYVPVVIFLAAFTALALPRLVGGGFDVWFYRSLILLVVSCPSAFIVSVPATIFIAITVAAKRGIIIKGGAYMEKLADIKAVVFDKTGTLTSGKPVVNDITTAEQLDEVALQYAAALEQHSTHPLARAIVKRASEQNLNFKDLKVKNLMEIPGKGVVGDIDGSHVIVGNMELMNQYRCNCEKIRDVYENEEHTAVCVSIDKSAVAAMCVIDEVRSDAAKTIRTLKETGIHTVMLTGDKKEIASEVAQQLAIDEVYSELFPEQKLTTLNKLTTKYGKVAMVGDGVNDAPALAASDVGIAMGGSAVDVAMESSDIVLVEDKISQIPYMLRLGKSTVKVAKQNIVASLIVKIALGALGLLGFIPLWFTVASGDDGVTLLLLLNTVRLTKLS